MSSLLAPKPNPIQSIPAVIRIRNEAAQIKAAPRRLVDTLMQSWERPFDLLWANPNSTPAELLAEIGTDAAELFAENAALVQFLVSRLAGKDDALVAKIMAKVATIPSYTANQDGTVTLD